MPANDPLAELARLIGQNDPFAETGPPPEQAQHAEQAQHPEQAQQPEQGGYDPDQVPPDHGDHAEPYLPEFLPEDRPEFAQQSPEDLPPMRFGPGPESAQEGPEDLPPLRFGARPEPQPESHDNWAGLPAPSDSYQQPPESYQQPQESYGLPPPIRPLPGFGAPAYSDPMIQPPDDYQAERTAADPLPGFLAQRGEPPHFSEQPYPQPYGQEPPIYPPQPDAGAMPAPHDDEFYDDAPRSGGRRKGLLTVAAVLALAVVGTASAVAYRNYFGGGGVSGPPPVIRASAEPSKVAPPAPSVTVTVDPSAGKISYDRFADRGKDEKIVGREEKPIDQKDLARSSPSVATPPRSNASGNPPNTIGQTRAVRTVPITPNSGDMAMNSPSITPDSGLMQTPSAPQAGSNFPPPSVPAARPVESAPAAATQPATQAPPSRTASTARTTTRSATSGNAPLSLRPDAPEQSPPPSASAYRDANPPAPSRQASAAPAPRASAPPAAGGGRFLVQVSSQKSESEAEASYRGIQSKYSSVLSGQPHTVRRADLGTKGVYYRAMVGPFGTREQAVQLCSNLKSAGGDCVVQAN